MAIGRAHLLPALFGTIFVPPEVVRELERTHRSLPDFLAVRSPRNPQPLGQLALLLDRGEAEAIALALELGADYLLMDEKRGRVEARRVGLRVIGLLGVLIAAKQRGLLSSVGTVLRELENRTSFYVGEEVRQEVLRAAGENDSGTA